MVIGLLVLGVWGLVALLVGYGVLSGLTTLDRNPEQSFVELGELCFALAFVGSLTIGWIAVTALQVGWFSAPRTVLIALLISVALGLIGVVRRRGLWRPRVRATAPTWLLACLVLVGVAAYFRPAEFVVGGGDAGVYTNLGSVWSRSGAFTITEETLSSLPAELGPGLFRATPEGHVVEAIRLPGFYLESLAQGRIVPQFFPLHPVWMALISGFAGTEASLYATPLWAVMGVASLALVASRLFGSSVGALGGALLLITPLQIYFARYPTAETLTQALLWAGLYALIRFQDGEESYWGAVAGLAIGQVFLARIDAVPVLLVPAGCVVLAVRGRRWYRSLWFLLPFTVLLLQAVYQSLVLSWPYTWEIYGNLLPLGLKLLRSYGLAILGIGGLGGMGYRWLLRQPNELRCRIGSPLRWAVVATLLAAALFAYFVWPVTGEIKMVPYWYGSSSIPVMNHLNMVRLAWYLTPLGIWLGVAGVVGIILTEPLHRTWVVLGVGLSFTILYLYNILNNPYHIYAMRRYVPVVVPFIAMAAAYALVRVWVMRKDRRAAGWVAAAGVVTLILWLCYQGQPVWTLVEYKGLHSQIRDLANGLDPGAILLFDDEPPVGIGSTIGTPLQYMYGFTSYDLQEDRLPIAALARTVAGWVAQGRSVYWVVGSKPVLGPPQSLSPQPAFGQWLDTVVLERSYFEFPDDLVSYRVALEFYSLHPQMPGEVGELCASTTRIDIGTLDTTYLVSGFHDKELLGTRSARWTDGDASLALDCVPADGDEIVTVGITMAAWRALGMDQPIAYVSVGDVTSEPATLGDEFEVITLAVPAAKIASHGIRITSDTWVPHEHGVGADDRRLGVLVDTITITGDDRGD